MSEGNASERMMLEGAAHSMVIEALEADSFPPRSPTLMGYNGLTEYAPIWSNRYLQELAPMEKINAWEELGIGRLVQLYVGSTLKSFAELRREYGIPNHSFYRYLQIRHALNAQFKTQVVEWNRAPLLHKLAQSGTAKGLISELYAQISSKLSMEYGQKQK